ncbi:MAG TPA: acetyl-CoA carboxylase biotin carboxyl carrier protein subunit, partial [Acidimicrobiales bacterium]|nr:acetyl-CoA carboxylase biotin carboxyl carrier protein subunit [Acidimicrobiales bacterium]
DDHVDGPPGAGSDVGTIELVAADPLRVVLAVDGVSLPFDVATHPDLVVVDSPLGSLALQPVSRFPDPDHQAAPGSLLAPMPGSVVRVAVAEGDEVSEGQVLLWLEAMKMQHEVRAPLAGVVAELAVAAGQQVEVGEVLAVVRPADELADELAEPDTDPEQDQP